MNTTHDLENWCMHDVIGLEHAWLGSVIVQCHHYDQLSSSDLYQSSVRIPPTKPAFLSLSLPTSITCYLPQHNQSPTMLHTHSMFQANHIVHAPVLEVMSRVHYHTPSALNSHILSFESPKYSVQSHIDYNYQDHGRFTTSFMPHYSDHIRKMKYMEKITLNHRQN